MSAYVFIDVSRKQDYIYAHNRLRENLFRSFVIKSITEAVEDRSYENVISLYQFLKENSRGYEFVYSGGGNSIIRFESTETAQNFISDYSCRVLEEHPELELYISMVTDEEVESKYTYQNDEERERIIRDLLREKADRIKDARRSRFKRWSYGIEKIDETGQPQRVNCKWKDIEETIKKVRDDLFTRFNELLSINVENSIYKITAELDDYLKEDGKSYIGVIVIDGNKMGEMVKQINSFRELRTFSDGINRLYQLSVKEALQQYADCLKQRECLPQSPIKITPILMAGDDICLIVEAEHAVELAGCILSQIQEQSKQLKKSQPDIGRWLPDYLTACAGIAIVRNKYPFFEAVKFAESLCYQAKEQIHLLTPENGQGTANASFINWKIVESQVFNAKEYLKNTARLYDEVFHVKPVRIDQSHAIEGGAGREVYSFASIIRLATKIKEQNISHSLLRKLKQQMYSGKEAYSYVLSISGSEDSKRLREIVKDEFGRFEEKGYFVEDTAIKCMQGDQCVYTYILNDVLELLPYLTLMGETANDQ